LAHDPHLPSVGAPDDPGAARLRLAPEVRLLLASLHSEHAAARVARLVTEEVLDWDLVVSLAGRGTAQPRLWEHLARVEPGRVPREAAVRLERQASAMVFRMLRLEYRLTGAVSALAARGIRPMLLKGAGLAITAYGSFGERPMSDADLLVPPERAEEAWDALRAAGWLDVTGGRESRYRELHHHLPPLVHGDGAGIVIEIHRDLFPPALDPFLFGARELWSRARAVDWRGARVHVPGPLHQMLHACLHFAWSHMLKHGAWRTFRDVDRLGRGAFPWDEFVAEAVRVRGRTCCYWTLRLARDLVRAPVPERVLAALAPRTPGAVLRRLEQHFADELFHPALVFPSTRLHRIAWQMGIQPVRSGHGGCRPWGHDELGRFGATPAGAVPEGAKLERWWRYLQSVLRNPRRREVGQVGIGP
jgi:hypothetical protein